MRGGKWRRRGALLVGALLLLLGLDTLLYPSVVGVGGRSLDSGENGLWLRYTWYFGEREEDEIRELAAQLQERGIRDAYFHVRFITREGSLRFRYPETARRLTDLLREEAPEVRVWAWVYAGNERGIGEGFVDLSDPAVRAAMVEEARWLVEEGGFAGVQWDYEICADADPHFLALLRETRAALPAGALLGAATPMWLPSPARRLGYGWSEAYFTDVAGVCDQLAVMCYDSGLYLPRAYVALVREQAVRVPRAVGRAESGCRVLLGVPTYEEGPRSHHARAENLRLALKGVREGLASRRAETGAFAGVALFADYTTTPKEWETYRALWRGAGAPP